MAYNFFVMIYCSISIPVFGIILKTHTSPITEISVYYIGLAFKTPKHVLEEFFVI